MNKRPPRNGEIIQKIQNTLLVDGNSLFKTGFFCISLIFSIFIYKEINMGKKLTHSEFINKANLVHNNKFKYLEKYLGNKIKIKITCPIHGDFIQRPNDHLNGDGCSKCSGKYKLSEKEFVEKSNLIHNNLYDYSNITYKGLKKNIIIGCKIHGLFSQKCENHLNGCGCPKCAKKKFLTTEQFIEKAKLIHGEKYFYPEPYVSYNTKINIGCFKHGLFLQSPASHLNSFGCKECTKPNINEFIEKSKIIHNDLYDYSLVKYIDSKTKLDIICREHGIFKQKLNDHLYGNGCPICKQSKGEIEIKKFLVENKIEFIPQKRFNDCKYKSQLPFDFFLPNKKICIEYNGIQHYEYRKFFHRNEDSLEIQKLKDKIKLDYCNDKEIKLVVIKYDENISDKLNEIIA